MSAPYLVLSRRIRKTPYEDRVIAHKPKAFSVYNHMPLVMAYESPEADYHHLCEYVQIWDVSVERQVEVVGPDALRLVELVTPRDVSGCQVGQCMYAPLADERGYMVNDPVLLKLAEDRFWLSIADSDVRLWLRGIAWGMGLDVQVFEPDVSPLAVQGPLADDLMADVVGEHVRDIRFFWFIEATIAGTDVLLARSGWSGQGGYEIYLQDSARGLDLWDTIWEAGQKYNIRPGCPNLIERIEASLLSFGSDITRHDSPFEAGLGRFCDLDKAAECLSMPALKKEQAEGLRRKRVNLLVHGEQSPSPRVGWDVKNADGTVVGMVTSLAFSPRYGTNVSFAMLDIDYTGKGQQLVVEINGKELPATVSDRSWS